MADSLQAARILNSYGLSEAGPSCEPSLTIVNTCAVTAEAVRKSKKAVNKCLSENGKVIVTGCAVKYRPEIFRGKPNVEVVISGDLPEFLSSILPKLGSVHLPSNGMMVRVPVKVQDGCARYCTYCIVPYLRGKPRSLPVSEVVDTVLNLEKNGVGEVILCGIDLGSYRNPENGVSLCGLIREVLRKTSFTRIRLSSIELSDVTGELLQLMDSEERLARHLHIPLQSGDERVLSDMGRKYTPEEFEEGINKVKEEIPDISLTTDVMVGFPTETEKAHQKTKELLTRLGFSRVHAFRYSPRPPTLAFALGDRVSSETKKRRALELREVGQILSTRFNEKMVGRIIQVLIEEEDKERTGYLFGRAGNYARVLMPGGPQFVGMMVNARVEFATTDYVVASILSRE